jgi:transglutaminase-like putative cysteine protease
MRYPILLWLLVLLTAAQAAAPEPALEPALESARWHLVVADDGTTVGTIMETRSADGRESRSEQRFTVQERGDSPTEIVERSTTYHDAAGAVVRIVRERRAGRNTTTTEARLLPGRAEIVRRSQAAPPTTTAVPLPVDIRFDGGIGLLAGWERAANPELAFTSLNVDAMKVERVVISAAPAATRVPAGHSALLRRSFEGESLRSVQLLILDGAGRIVETRQPIFGAVMTIRPASAAEASRPIPPYRPLARALVQSPFRIPAGALDGHIRYRFSFRDGIAFPLPVTSEQRVTPGEAGATIDICRDCGPGLSTTPEALAEARRPTPWLQSNHPRVQALATPVRYSGVSDARRMLALVRIVEQQIVDIDFAGHFTAVETLARRRGDCTESAVLLAALGRSIGIPTKVASGLVYSRGAYHGTSNVFLPHSWVLAYVDGRWRSFDAALGAFDSSHIALTIGDGDARSIAAANQLAGLISWQEMQEVRRRPAR